MKRLLKRLYAAHTKGQSMVEMAIIAPILIFFLIGIFEVGWALRNYLVLVNTNREITRYAIRPGYMDFSSDIARDDSYENVRVWAHQAASGQIALDFEGERSTLVISHLVIDTGLPCEDIHTAPGDCNCNWFDPNHGDYNDPLKAEFTKDDIVIHPGIPNYEYQTITYGITETVSGESRATRFDYAGRTASLADQNNKFNCEIIKKGGVASANNLIVTELFHDQPQLFGFPVISNPFTDPVPLYTHTVMRLISAARASGGVEGSLIAGIDAIGEVCFAYPLIVSKAQLDGPPVKNIGQQIDILDGAAEYIIGNDDHKGFVAWNRDEATLTELEYELTYPQMSVNSFRDYHDLTDTTLTLHDHVASVPGVGLGDVLTLATNLVGQQIIVPVWDGFPGGAYQISDFILVTVTNVDAGVPVIEATYNGQAPAACIVTDD